MTLERQIRTLSFVVLGALALFAIATAMVTLDLRRQVEQIELAESMTRSVAQFRYLVMETVLYREQRSAQQWRSLQQSFAALVEHARHDTEAQRRLLAREQAGYRVLDQLYRRIAPDPGRPAPAPDLVASTASAMFVTSQDMIEDGFDLVTESRRELRASQYRALALMVACIAALAAIVLAWRGIVRRRVLRPLAELKSGMEQVTRGDLAFRLDLRTGDEIGAVGAAFDSMTEQLAASQAALQHAQDELRTIIDHIPALIVYWDAQLRNRFANKAYLDWFGTSPEQMRGHHITEVIGEQRFRAIEPFLRAALAGERQIFERALSTEDGVERHALFAYVPDVRDGEVKGCYGIISDVTPLKRAQAGEAGALQLLRSTVDAASDFAIIATDLEGQIQLFSRGAERLLGYTADEVVGRFTPRLFHLPAELAQRGAELTSALGRAVEGFRVLVELPHDGRSESREWTYVRKDGATLPVNLTVTAVADAQGTVTGYLGVAKDVTQEKAILASLSAARDAAQAASLAKSQFLANMSHEIRTPMNAILGLVQLLADTPLSATQREYVAKTDGAARSLLGILNDVLDVSKMEAGKMVLECEPFDVDGMLRTIAVILGAGVGGRDIDVFFTIDPALPAVLAGDELRLRQVLLNLGTNAVKYTQAGEVELALSVCGSGPGYVDVACSVRDTGVGLEADKLTHIFEAFGQADASTTRRFGGTGLGLTISQKLVSLMGGTILVNSVPGQGSVFSFMARMAVPPQPAPPAAPGQGRTVLLVEGDTRFRAATANMLDLEGWYVHVLTPDEYRSGAALPPHALALHGLHPGDDPALVGARQTTPLLWMAGSHGIVDAGAPHLSKPFTRAMLRGALAAALEMPAAIDAAPARMGGRLSGMRVLVVDDNEINQLVAREFLTLEGVLVDVAGGGIAGVAMALAAAPPYDAVLMDVQMPDQDGYASARAIRAHAALDDMPIIAMTANVMADDRDACMSAGMDGYIEKPVELDKLVNALQRYRKGAQPAAPTPAPAGAPVPSADDAVVDYASALVRLGCNEQLYADLIGMFATEAAQSVDGVTNALAQSRWLDAANVLHTLKNSANMVGAHGLQLRCEALERPLRAGQAAPPESAAQLAACVSATCAALGEVARQLKPAAPA